MDIKKHIDSLFSDYHESPALKDFKEELNGHLDERIKSLIKKGLDEKTALEKALGELGDISQVADEIGKKKRQEAFEEMYMSTRKYLTPKRAALYIFGGLIIGFGLIFAAVTWFATEMEIAALPIAMTFCAVGIALMVFLGLTQETPAKYPMSVKRAIWYAAAVGVFIFGTFSVPFMYFAVNSAGLAAAELVAEGFMSSQDNSSIMTAVMALIPFVLPSIALFVFLALTEKDRRKPWAVTLANEQAQQGYEYFKDPAKAMQFGLISGAIWIAAIAGFVVLTICVGILWSWLVFAGAIVLQLLTQALLMDTKK